MIPLRLLLRQHRVGLVAMTYFGIVYALVNSAAYPIIAGKTAAAQAVFGAQMHVLATQIVWLLPLPVHPETVAGYLQWRAYGFLAIVFPAWALLSACGGLRGDEDRGFVEIWLAAGVSRVRYLVQRCATFAGISAVVIVVSGVAAWVGTLLAGAAVAPQAIAETSVALWGLTLACYGITAIVVQQTTTFRSSAATAGVVLLALFLVDSLRRSMSPAPAFGGLSPFSLNDRTDAIAPGGSFDVAATLILFGVALGTMLLALWLYRTRDIGAGIVRMRPASTRSRSLSMNPLLRMPVVRGLWQRRLPIAIWTVACAALAAFVVAIINGAAGLFTTTSLAPFLRGLSGDIHIVLLGLVWFAFAQALLAIFAITYVWRWADDDANGILELELSQPVGRVRITIERALELTAALVVVAFVSSLVGLGVAHANHIDVPLGSMLLAAVLLVPFGLTFAAVGAVLAAFRPRLAVGVLVTVTVASYLLFQLAPAFRLPSWVADLSVFQLYGTPLITSLFVGGLLAMLGIVVAGFSAAGTLALRRDVAR